MALLTEKYLDLLSKDKEMAKQKPQSQLNLCFQHAGKDALIERKKKNRKYKNFSGRD